MADLAAVARPGIVEGSNSTAEFVVDQHDEVDTEHIQPRFLERTPADYYRAQGQPDKAFWEYLWVEVHYNQDREEVSKALYYLSKLFAAVRKDPVRAKECLERLSDEKQFGGLEYHRKALAEKSAGGG